MVFGRLLVLSQTDDYINPSGRHFSRWLCQCQCQNKTLTSVGTTSLKTGTIKSCGCLKSEKTIETHRKHNIYDLSGDYGVGYTVKNEVFYFDLEDYDKIKDYYWSIDKYGYVVNTKTGIKQHRLIMGIIDCQDVVVDHVYHNTNDNRKQFLRLCTYSENNKNKQPNRSYKYKTGVDFLEKKCKWRSRICVNYKTIYLGNFDDYASAVKARELAEDKYFGEFSYKEQRNE